jgi:hypothetical protein
MLAMVAAHRKDQAVSLAASDHHFLDTDWKARIAGLLATDRDDPLIRLLATDGKTSAGTAFGCAREVLDKHRDEHASGVALEVLFRVSVDEVNCNLLVSNEWAEKESLLKTLIEQTVDLLRRFPNCYLVQRYGIFFLRMLATNMDASGTLVELGSLQYVIAALLLYKDDLELQEFGLHFLVCVASKPKDDTPPVPMDLDLSKSQGLVDEIKAIQAEIAVGQFTRAPELPLLQQALDKLRNALPTMRTPAQVVFRAGVLPVVMAALGRQTDEGFRLQRVGLELLGLLCVEGGDQRTAVCDAGGARAVQAVLERCRAGEVHRLSRAARGKEWEGEGKRTVARDDWIEASAVVALFCLGGVHLQQGLREIERTLSSKSAALRYVVAEPLTKLLFEQLDWGGPAAEALRASQIVLASEEFHEEQVRHIMGVRYSMRDENVVCGEAMQLLSDRHQKLLSVGGATNPLLQEDNLSAELEKYKHIEDKNATTKLLAMRDMVEGMAKGLQRRIDEQNTALDHDCEESGLCKEGKKQGGERKAVTEEELREEEEWCMRELGLSGVWDEGMDDKLFETFDCPITEWIAKEQITKEIAYRFRTFLASYTDDNHQNVYMEKINALCTANKQSLLVSYVHLSRAAPTLAIWLADAPIDMIEIFDQVAMSEILAQHPTYKQTHDKVFVRITDLPISDAIRDLGQVDLNSMVRVRGVVTRRTSIFPELKMVKYNCTKCGHIRGPYPLSSDDQHEHRVGPCPECQQTGPFTLSTEGGAYRNYQKLTLHETLGSVPPGAVPQHQDIVLTGDLIDLARPGEEIEVTGAYSNQFYDRNRNGSLVFCTDGSYLDGIPVLIRANYVQIMTVQTMPTAPGIDQDEEPLDGDAGSTPRLLQKGCAVTIRGLVKTFHYNGKEAVVLEHREGPADSENYVVEVVGEKALRVLKRVNLVVKKSEEGGTAVGATEATADRKINIGYGRQVNLVDAKMGHAQDPPQEQKQEQEEVQGQEQQQEAAEQEGGISKKKKNKKKKKKKKKQAVHARVASKTSAPVPLSMAKGGTKKGRPKASAHAPVSSTAWPLWPLAQDTIMHWERSYERACAFAVPMKESGSALFKGGNVEGALKQYCKGLYQFEHLSMMLEQLHVLCLGASRCHNSNNPLQLFASKTNRQTIFVEIGSYLCSSFREPCAHQSGGLENKPNGWNLNDRPLQRIAAECASNASLMLRKLQQPGKALVMAVTASRLDRTFMRALDREVAALKICCAGSAEGERLLQLQMATIDRRRLFFAQDGMGPGQDAPPWTMASLMNKAVPTTQKFAELDQWRAVTALAEVIKVLPYTDDAHHNKVVLGCSLVPFTANAFGSSTDDDFGQWLNVSFRWFNRRTGEDVVASFHMAEADPLNGDDLELPPHGKPTAKALKFAGTRIVDLAVLLQRRYFHTRGEQPAVTIMIELGQGLRGLLPTDPSDNRLSMSQLPFVKEDSGGIVHLDRIQLFGRDRLGHTHASRLEQRRVHGQEEECRPS